VNNCYLRERSERGDEEIAELARYTKHTGRRSCATVSGSSFTLLYSPV
jgi:hypothetical protein